MRNTFYALLSSLLMLCAVPCAAAQAAESLPLEGKRIVMVLTSHSVLRGTGKKTGFWFEELATPYYRFKKAGAEVTLASIRGGQPPADPLSQDRKIASVARFMDDAEAMRQLADTLPASRLKAEDYDAVFLVGGHGAVWDFGNSTPLMRMLQSLVDAEKPIAAISHGIGALVALRDKEGKPLLADKRLTAFTRSEEKAMGLQDVVPSYLDAQLKSLEAKVEAAPAFKARTVRDGLLVTGQNPASSGGTAEALIEVLRERRAARAKQ